MLARNLFSRLNNTKDLATFPAWKIHWSAATNFLKAYSLERCEKETWKRREKPKCYDRNQTRIVVLSQFYSFSLVTCFKTTVTFVFDDTSSQPLKCVYNFSFYPNEPYLIRYPCPSRLPNWLPWDWFLSESGKNESARITQCHFCFLLEDFTATVTRLECCQQLPVILCRYSVLTNFISFVRLREKVQKIHFSKGFIDRVSSTHLVVANAAISLFLSLITHTFIVAPDYKWSRRRRHQILSLKYLTGKLWYDCVMIANHGHQLIGCHSFFTGRYTRMPNQHLVSLFSGNSCTTALLSSFCCGVQGRLNFKRS